ncbi:MAG TPA: hypothetical protein VGN44_13150 [Candidatus Angelobacter sp.]|jgi:hypothetical protein
MLLAEVFGGLITEQPCSIGGEMLQPVVSAYLAKSYQKQNAVIIGLAKYFAKNIDYRIAVLVLIFSLFLFGFRRKHHLHNVDAYTTRGCSDERLIRRI